MHVLQCGAYALRYTYSQSGEPTIIPKNSNNIKLGQATSLSRIDKLKINKLYDCGQQQNFPPDMTDISDIYLFI